MGLQIDLERVGASAFGLFGSDQGATRAHGFTVAARVSGERYPALWTGPVHLQKLDLGPGMEGRKLAQTLLSLRRLERDRSVAGVVVVLGDLDGGWATAEELRAALFRLRHAKKHVYVYLAEATGDTGFASPAVFEIMQLQGNNLVLSGNKRMALSSFVATSVAASGTKAYATSGDAGSLFVIDPATFAISSSIPLHDARWVAADGGKVAVVQGTPGVLSVYNESNMSLVGNFPFAGADIAESKSQAELVGGKAFIAAGDSGVQVLSASTGLKLGFVPRPNPDSLGLSPSVVVTNAVTIDQDLMFISNGEAGVYVAQGSQVFSATGSEAQQTITMLGKLRFGNLQSVNHVALQSGLLIIAAGLGGLKIVQTN
jgi:hypothetical protein